MKTHLYFLIAISFATTLSWAQMAVQRTTTSSYEEYQKYLSKSGHQSFVQSYIHLSSVTEMETPLLEKCLEEIYVGAHSQNSCLAAVKSLTSKPFNQPRREVLFQFLSKIERIKSPKQTLYRGLKQGLLKTHPEMAKVFQADVKGSLEDSEPIQELEMKAWKKALQKKFPFDEIALLINGKKVSKLEKWQAPSGIYQWTLVTNTHEPIVRLGSFSQFASESLISLKALAQGNCSDLKTLDEKSFGLIRFQVFADPKCVAQFGGNTQIAKSPHLGNSANMVKMDDNSNRHWIWPVVAIVSIGVATSLQNKQVSVGMPSFR